MKKIVLLLINLLFLNCISQIKINKSEDVDILINLPQKLDANREVILRNNVKKTFIIDPLGFHGKSFILVNNEVIEPINYVRGHYERLDLEMCKTDFILLKPYETKKVFINFVSNDKKIYDYSKYPQFIRVVKSHHSYDTATSLGCRAYLDNLEKMGYKILSDSISAKIPYIK